MSGELPLQVHGLMAPILCWVEGSEGYRLPESWMGEQLTVEKREFAWLTRELPTYSHDSLAEILRLGQEVGDLDLREEEQRLFDHRRSLMSPPPGYDLETILGKLSERYFEWSGNELTICSERLVELHELALRFPVRHLIRYRHARSVAHGALAADRALELPEQMGRLHTTSQGIRAVVERGLTEGHLHLGGVTSADEGWADHLLHRLSGEELRRFKPEEQRLLTLSRAAVRLLAIALLHVDLPAAASGLPDHREIFDGAVFSDLLAHLDRLYLASNRQIELEARRQLQYRLNRYLAEQWRLGLPERLRAADREADWLLDLLDPRISFLRLNGSRPFTPRNRRLRQRLRLLERLHFEVARALIELSGGRRGPRRTFQPEASRQQRRKLLHEILYRYLVYHTHHWHLAIQSGRTTGLQQFKQFFSARQRRTLSSKVEERGWVLESLGRYAALRAVEGRIGPPEGGGAADLVPWVLGHAASPDWPRPEKFGLIIHFIKRHYPEDDRPLSRGPRSPRHGAMRRNTRNRARELFRLLSSSHPVVPFIVGIDAANFELEVPPEVFAPAFRFLREFPIELRQRYPAAEHLGCFREISQLVASRRLGMTFHVGEDFRHLLSGLRAIDEVIEFLRPQPGDRLGHALALALQPEVWMSQIGYQAVLPRQEWLDTLVWVHQLCGAGHDLLGELDVEHRIQRLSRKIYDAPRLDGSVSTLADSWRLRQLDPYSLQYDPWNEAGRRDSWNEAGRRDPWNEAGRQEASRRREPRLLSPRSKSGEDLRWLRVQRRTFKELHDKLSSDDAYEFLRMYWFDQGVRRRGGEVVPVDMQGESKRHERERWQRLYYEVQAKVRRRVQREQLVVEVNPSSNRVIGPMARFADHPIFRLTLDEEGQPSRELRVTVNTDDPGVFNTSLAHEYYLLAEIQLQRGVPEAQVVEWLEWLRRNGKDYSFLRTLPKLKNKKMVKILESLQRTHRSLPDRLAGRRRDFFRHRDDRSPVPAADPLGHPISNSDDGKIS